jgi:hypothetical protein
LGSDGVAYILGSSSFPLISTACASSPFHCPILAEEGEVKLTIQDGNLIVTPARPGKLDSEALGETLDYVVKKRKSVLKRLAQ